MRRYRGARALVTGASSGIGRALAFELARRGAFPVLTGRNGPALEEVAGRIRRRFGVEADIVVVDLLEDGAPRRLLDAVEGRGKAVDLLVNNAGAGTFGAFGQIPLERERGILRLNIEALVALTWLHLPRMIARGRGGILNVVSTAAFSPVPYMAVYAASKAFVLSFSEALAAEVRGTGVRVTALCPGPTRTDFHRRAEMPVKEPDVRFEAPEEVARRGLDAFLRGRRTVVSGRLNRLMTQAARYLPRSLVVAAAERMVRPRGGPPWSSRDEGREGRGS